ncbi:MAG: oligosaccharide flippase family protein [Nitrospirae bacterium]|nr:oligosaccharide flippase family protein [Nitrospirota bacterium]
MDVNSKTKDALKSLAGFSLFTFATTIIRFGLRIAKNVVFTRVLGPAERGVFGLLTTIPDLIVSFGNLGFGLGSVYLVANKQYDMRKIVGNILVFTLGAGFLMVGIGYVLFHFEGILKDNNDMVRGLAPFALVIIPFVLLQRFGEDLLTSIKKIHFLNRLNTLFSFLPIALIVVFWLLTCKTLISALLAWAVSVLVVSVAAFISVSSEQGFRFGVSGAYFKEALFYGGRGFFSIFAGVLVKRIDYVFVSSMLGAESLGLYTVSVSLAEIILSIPQALNLPFLPIRLGLAKEDASEFTPIVIRHVVFVMLVVCVCVAVGGKLIIFVMFGKRFLNAYHSLLWLLPGMIALSIHGFLKSDMYSHNLPGFVSWTELTSLVVNVGLNYFYVIPMYGIEGAAFSSSVAYWLSTMIMLVKYMSLSNISFKDVLVIRRSELKNIVKLIKR